MDRIDECRQIIDLNKRGMDSTRTLLGRGVLCFGKD